MNPWGVFRTSILRRVAHGIAIFLAISATLVPSAVGLATESVDLPSRIAVCGACHGPAGVSAAPEIPSLAGQHASYLIEMIRNYRSPKSHSPLMSALSSQLNEAEVIAVANHYASLPYVRQKQAVDREKVQRGEATYRAVCVVCHQDGGRSSTYAEYPLLAGQSIAYIGKTMREILAGIRPVDALKLELLSDLDPEEIDDALQFFAGQEVDPSQISSHVAEKPFRRRNGSP